MSLVSLVRFKKEEASLQVAIEKSLDLIGFKFDPTAERVAIKPNLCYYWDYSTGETTDPNFVGAVVDILRKHIRPDARISIVESDASAMNCKHVFKMLGYERLAQEKQIQLVNLTKDQSQEVTVTITNQKFQFLIPNTIREADLLINVPKMKYMQRCKFSGSLKNIYGCNPYPQKHRYHQKLDEVIVSLNKIMKTDICILDGIITKGMATRRLDLIVASTDPVALDSASARIAGMNPHSIRHLRLAAKEGLGRIDLVTTGEPIQYFEKLFPRKKVSDSAKRLLSKVYTNVQRTVFRRM
jgi:uncharacterized protein (DUF362 family)